MKSLGPIAGVLLLCLVASCHKDQIESSPERGNDSITFASSSDEIIQSDWIKGSNWEVATQPTHSVYHIEINLDRSATQGNVVVFQKNVANSHSAVLPYEEIRGNQKIYWYYEMNGDKIMISADVYGVATNPFITSAFKYLVVNNATMGNMERSGINRTQLMGMSYENFMEINQ